MGFQGGNIGLRKCESIESRAFRRLPVSGKGLFVLFRNLIAKREEKKSERKVSFRMEILELVEKYPNEISSNSILQIPMFDLIYKFLPNRRLIISDNS